jgi:membrane protein YdbS with pleckstrin-like domain
VVERAQSLPCPRCRHFCTFDSHFCNRCGVTLKGLVRSQAEKEVWESRVSWHVLWPAAALYLAYAVVVCAAFRWLSSEPGAATWIVLGLLLAAPAGYLAYFAIRLKLVWRYRLTTHRLQVFRGWPKHEVEEVPLDRIDDIVVRQNLFQRLSDVGRIMVISAGAGHLRLVGIRRPVWRKDLIQALVEAHRTIGQNG